MEAWDFNIEITTVEVTDKALSKNLPKDLRAALRIGRRIKNSPRFNFDQRRSTPCFLKLQLFYLVPVRNKSGFNPSFGICSNFDHPPTQLSQRRRETQTDRHTKGSDFSSHLFGRTFRRDSFKLASWISRNHRCLKEIFIAIAQIMSWHLLRPVRVGANCSVERFSPYYERS